MTFEQIALLALLAALMAAYALDRWHVEVVALTGLAAAFLLGLVPVDRVFTGFADPAVVTVVEILIIAQAIGRSRVVDVLARKVAGLALGEATTVALLCAMGAAISVFMNNIGALALMIPVAYSVCAARGIPLRAVLMPISFATLLGGLCSLIGTPANLVVNSAEQAASGMGFAFFAFAPVGLVAACCSASSGSPSPAGSCLPTAPEPSAGDRYYPTDLFLTEVAIPAGSELIGRSVSDVERENQVSVHGAFRADARIFARKDNQILAERDLILVSGSVEAIRGFLRRHNLQPAVSETETALPADRIWAETVVMPQSTMIGSPVGAIAAFLERNIQVVAISPQGPRIEGRLGDVAPAVGDILLLRGAEADIAEALKDTQSVPLATRSVLFGSPDALMPLLIFAGAIVIATLELVPPQIAFGGAVLLMTLLRLPRPPDRGSRTELAGDHHARRDAAGGRGPARHRHGGDPGALGTRRGRHPVRDGADRLRAADRHPDHAVPQQRDDGGVARADRGQRRRAIRAADGAIPGRRRDWRVDRFPDALRASQQHPRHGPRPLPVRGLSRASARP